MPARCSFAASVLLLALGAGVWIVSSREIGRPRAAGVARPPEDAARSELTLASAQAVDPPASSPEPERRRALDPVDVESASSAEVASRAAGPLLVAGRVVDALGAPLPGAELELECFDSTRRKFAARSDAGGRFELRGAAPELGGVLSARCAGFAPHVERLESLTLDASTERVLVLRRGASVRGELRADAGLAPERFELLLVTRHDAFRARPAPTGAFEFVDLPAGDAELGVQYDGRPVLWLQGLSLAEGQRTADPRLDPLDLRGRLRAWSLRLVNPDGLALATKEVGVRWSVEPLQGSWVQRTDGAGRIDALLPAEVERLWLDIEGFQDPWVSPDVRELVALPMPTVRIGVDAIAPELAGRVRLELGFLDAAPPGGVSARRASLGEDGTADFVLDHAGRYQLSWVPLALGSTPLAWSEHVIDVRPTPREQFFELGLDAAQLAELRDAVGN